MRCTQNADRYFLIGDNGVTLAAYQSLLVETAETVATPYNVFGIVTGKGAQIFRGTFISTGKINPGFNSKLKIGIYNGSNNPFVIRRGDPLCSCVFFEMELSILAPLKSYDDGAAPLDYLLTVTEKTKLWLRRNKDYFSIILPLVAILVAIASVAVTVWLKRK